MSSSPCDVCRHPHVSSGSMIEGNRRPSGTDRRVVSVSAPPHGGLPVGRQVLDALWEAIERPSPPAPNVLIFPTSRYARPWTTQGYSSAMTRAMQQSRIEALRGYKPRWLRACFASAVLSVGADRTLVKVSMGHSQGDVLGLHYEQISIERLPSTILPALENGATNPAQARNLSL